MTGEEFILQASEILATLVQRYCGRGQDCDDLKQTVLAKLLEKINGGQPLGETVEVPKAWLTTVMYRTFIDEWRKQQRGVVDWGVDITHLKERENAPGTSPHEVLALKELEEKFEQAMQELPPTQRQAFRAVHLLGLTPAEYADRINSTVAAVRQNAIRARVALRDAWAKRGPAAAGGRP